MLVCFQHPGPTGDGKDNMKMWTTILWGLCMVTVFGGLVAVWLVAMIHAGIYG